MLHCSISTCIDCKYCSFLEFVSLSEFLGRFVEILFNFDGELNFSLITNNQHKTLTIK